MVTTARKESAIHLSAELPVCPTLLVCVGGGGGGEQTRGKMGFENQKPGFWTQSAHGGEPICDLRIITLDLRKSIKH